MYGQMTVGSWIYIGTQGILQGTYETFAECARKYFDGSLAGRLVVSAGLGGMGGAQPLAVTMNGGVFLGIEVDAARVKRRVETGYCDQMCSDLDEALNLAEAARQRKEPLSVGLVGNVAEILPGIEGRGILPDILTDQTSAHDIDVGYIPVGYGLAEAEAFRTSDLNGYRERVLDSMVRHVQAMLQLKKAGSIVFDYGNNLRGQVADHRGFREAFQIPGFVPEFIRPLFCRGSGPFRGWHFRGILMTLRSRMRPSWKPFRKRPDSDAGSNRLPKGFIFRACLHGSAGSNMGSVQKWA